MCCLMSGLDLVDVSVGRLAFGKLTQHLQHLRTLVSLCGSRASCMKLITAFAAAPLEYTCSF
jgi:hypothetical protein